MDSGVLSNPFPGLRPFEPDEDHLFFGREKQIDELLRRLRGTRFLSVVGASGSGKSSLVRCGLIPALQGGSMAGAGSGWRAAVLRPGEDPIGHLAGALSLPECLGAGEELADVRRVLVEATLRRSTLGLAEAVREARVPAHESILVVVDQFEELFRFRRNQAGAGDDAAVFVKMLLEAARHDTLPIYIVLTMRSDFIGDCMQYPGLPEAVNAGLYLVPRMSRDELRSAIAGPVAVGGGQVTPRLVVRLLNEVGDNADQLPVLQHALMRTWDYWQSHGGDGEPIDIAHYEAIGGMQRALSLHAEEAYAEAASEAQRRIAERSFKALTDTFTDPRGVRRPTAVGELAAVCEAPEPDVVLVLELFRRPGRSFLMPPAGVPLDSRSVVDLSHESLMRRWDRLVAWTDQERISAARYVRLSRAAAWNEEGSAGLWRDPELELGLQWRRETRPTAAWAARYDPAFGRAMAFLDRSRQERDALIAERERERRSKLRQARWAAGILAALLAIAGVLGLLAAGERNRAERNLHTANDVVDKLLLAAGGDSERDAAQIPEMETFRKKLLDQARAYLNDFTKQKPSSREYREEMAQAHRRLGDINRLLQQNPDAAAEYQTAIAQFEALRQNYPADPGYRNMQAGAYNWLGEAERVLETGHAEAEKAYASAIGLEEDLCRSYPANALYKQNLARTHDNRGILRAATGNPTQSEADYREAIRLLDPLMDLQSRRALAHAYNNLAILLETQNRPDEAKSYYEQAISIQESVAGREPGNRDYAFELAKMYNNLAMLLEGRKDYQLSLQYNGKAALLFEDLARPALTFTIELAQVHTLRGRTLQAQGARAEADEQYRQSIGMLAELAAGDAARGRTDFHARYGEALFQLGALLQKEKNPLGARGLLSQAVEQHAAARAESALCFDYYWLAEANLELGAADQAQKALDQLAAALPKLPESERGRLGAYAQQLQKKLDDQKRDGRRTH
jgi:tetratricopeptide (TPR) repeat protein/energy-coupling factor transporter ATP-binding protein EcfA2